jgi:hypothetical protein
MNAKNGSKNGSTGTPKAPGASAKIDGKQVKAMLLKVFAFRESIEEKKRQLEVEAQGVNELLKAILDATNGHRGPYELDGRRYIVMSRTVEAKDEDGNTILDKDGKKVTSVMYYLRAPATEPEVVRL